MSIQESLYKEIILEHAKDPSHSECLEKISISQEGVNRSCGDEIELQLYVQDGRIEGIRVCPKGCSISIASASMMAENIEKLNVQEAKVLISSFKAMITEGKGLEVPNAIEQHIDKEELQALNGVRKYPIRVKCATLAWSTLEQAIQGIEAQE